MLSIQNMRTRGPKNQRRETSVLRQRSTNVMTWFGLLGVQMLIPYIFSNEFGNETKINGDRYLHLLKTMLYPAILQRREIR